uniref:Integrase catalytic domain-containing protein n=1 Tax=Vitis vinifera TaxID=29760 RepID=A5AVA0_VITVI|nr:hypothetical protein VITISV_015208 [Vitis vinifera]
MATWSESEESFEEEKEKEVANICFMAIDELDEDIQNDKTIFMGHRCDNVYAINISKYDGHDRCFSSMHDQSWLWHRRLGHANMDLISQLNKDELVRGLPKINFQKDKVCEACQVGKQIKNSFKNKNFISTSRPLELLHMDLFGPSRTPSLRGKSYTYVIMDDFSRYTWVLFLNQKNEAFYEFSKFCNKVQNEKGFTITCIRSDHGREFENIDFEKYCNEHGINHNFSAPRTPQQNGVWRSPWEDCKLKIEGNKKNKERLVAQGFNQEEGIDYEETFALVPRLEAIRMLLAFTFFKDIVLYQMDVKSDFLNGFINEEVYVEQPPGFQSFNFPNHVFKLKKALYGLKQEPRACEFEMSMIGELNFFLGLQIKKLKEGTFINQAKYIRDLLKRLNMEKAKTMKTSMSSSIKLDKDEKGLWYLKSDNFELIGFSDADFIDCTVERKSISGTCHFLGHSLVSWHIVAATFGALFEVQLMHAIYHFKAQEVKNPMLQTEHQLDTNQLRHQLGMNRMAPLPGKWIRDSGGRLVKCDTPQRKEFEVILNIMEATPEDQHSHQGRQDNLNEFRSMRDRMHPPRMSAPSCIVPPTEQLVIRPYLVPLLPTFHGMESENPYAHIKEFEDVCNTFQEGGASIDLMRLKLFPFTLKDKAKIWLNSLRPRSIRSWTDLQAEFLKKFFPTHRTNGLKRKISNFSAKENEKFYECWERYMEAINACPHHGFDTWLLVSYFYDGMSSSMKQLLETMCGGDFMSKNPEEAMDFLSYVADVSRGWDEPTKGEVGKMKSQLNAYNAKAGMYTLKEDDDMKAKLAAMTRRLEELELKRIHEVQAVAEAPVQVKLCPNCKSYEHLVEECPAISAEREIYRDQANVVGQFRPNKQCAIWKYLQLKLEESSKFLMEG